MSEDINFQHILGIPEGFQTTDYEYERFCEQAQNTTTPEHLLSKQLFFGVFLLKDRKHKEALTLFQQLKGQLDLDLQESFGLASLISQAAYYCAFDALIAENYNQQLTNGRIALEHDVSPRNYKITSNALYALKRYRDAATLIDEALTLTPCDHDLLIQKADTEMQREQHTEAEITLNELLALEPCNEHAGAAFEQLGHISFAREQYKTALDYYNLAIEADSEIKDYLCLDIDACKKRLRSI